MWVQIPPEPPCNKCLEGITFLIENKNEEGPIPLAPTISGRWCWKQCLQILVVTLFPCSLIAIAIGYHVAVVFKAHHTMLGDLGENPNMGTMTRQDTQARN